VAAAAPEVDPTLALLTLSSVESSPKVAELGAGEEVDEEIFGAPSQATDAAPLASQDDDDAEDSPLGDDHDIDAQAADELFGGLLDFSPRHRRRSLARG
jgi:hypothetical protein